MTWPQPSDLFQTTICPISFSCFNLFDWNHFVTWLWWLLLTPLIKQSFNLGEKYFSILPRLLGKTSYTCISCKIVSIVEVNCWFIDVHLCLGSILNIFHIFKCYDNSDKYLYKMYLILVEVKKINMVSY